ncbi:MAG: hypothetical protein ACU84H_08860 [Gammaproteobacteria bacterium]
MNDNTTCSSHTTPFKGIPRFAYILPVRGSMGGVVLAALVYHYPRALQSPFVILGKGIAGTAFAVMKVSAQTGADYWDIINLRRKQYKLKTIFQDLSDMR